MPTRQPAPRRSARRHPAADALDGTVRRRRQRLQGLSLSFSMAAVLAACGGSADNGAVTANSSSATNSTDGTTSTTATGGSQREGAAAEATVGWTPCASEGETCSVSGTRQVRYGANGTYAYKTVTGSIGCSNAVWGDPIYGVLKACDYETATAPAPATWTACAPEGGTCAVQGTRQVRYGANGTFAFKTVTGSIVCSNAVWGDPIYGVLKACEFEDTPAPAPAPPPAPPPPAPAPDPGWTACAIEGGNCAVPSTRQVRYGASGTFAYKTVSGSIACSNAAWGDPLPNVVKACAYETTPGTAPPPPAPSPPPPPPAPPPAALSQRDAVRLADQATFGGTEALIAQMRTQGAAGWVKSQMGLNASRYTSGSGDAVHVGVQGTFFCDRAPYAGANCWRDWFSTQPLAWDFYRNAVNQPDQLRQRVAFALQQIVVVSNLEVSGTYGFRNYYNALLDNAFGNYRQVLRKVALSPVMGDFLNNANNDKAAPNENFARELLQLFSIGTCELNADGTLKGGACTPTYDNEMVRNYAFALTGWTYPAGGSTAWGCWPAGTNCTYYGGDMVPAAAYHDANVRALLSGQAKPADSTAATALERVLDSLMAHPNAGPFVGRQLIQFLVSSNPSPAYVSRVAQAFASGSFSSGGQNFGSGVRGDLAATVAAVLLDAEARGDSVAGPGAGRLREPVAHMTGALRAFNGSTDGNALAWWWGESMRQHVFRPPSVFNFYPPDYPVPGTALEGPAFGIHNANTALERLNYLVYLFEWGGSKPEADVPNAVGTSVKTDAFIADAADAAKLVDRISALALGAPLPPAQRTKVIEAVQWWTSSTDAQNWQANRVRTAAYLVYGSPNYQLQR